MIIKNKCTTKFTVIPNHVIEDKALDWKDLGLLAYLLSKPGTWNVRREQLINAKKTGDSGMRAILSTLQKAGYVGFDRKKDGTTEWWVTDTAKKPNVQNHHKDAQANVEKQHVENPHVENPQVLVKTERPLKTDKKVKTDLQAGKPTAPKKKNEPVTAKTWDAYSSAYQDRYGVSPIRNASVNGQLAQFVKNVGAEEAPHIARYFLTLNENWYVKGCHSPGSLLRDAGKLRTLWATGRQMTAAQATQADRTQGNANAYNDAMTILESKYANH